MAARSRKPRSGKQVPIAPQYNPEWEYLPVQDESIEYAPQKPKPSALDYIKASPIIAKELAPELINPIGYGSAESLSKAIEPELLRALVSARTGQGMGRPTQLSSNVTLSPELQMLSRLSGGAADALLNSNLASFVSADTLGKAVKQSLGYGKDRITKGDLGMLGLFYGTGPTYRAGKKGLKALKAILSKLP